MAKRKNVFAVAVPRDGLRQPLRSLLLSGHLLGYQ